LVTNLFLFFFLHFTVLGFEMIGEERRQTRRFVVANKDAVIKIGHIAFSYLGPLGGSAE
jgi:hypothetical protein